MKNVLPKATRQIIDAYIQGLCNIYGERLIKVTLFGSYARGDFQQDSDIDMLIIVDLDAQAINTLRKAMVHLTFEANMEHSVEIEPIVMSYKDYLHWETVHPLLHEVKKEGVSLYEAA